MPGRRFPVAKMSPLILGLTVMLLLVPVLFVAVALALGGPGRVVLLPTAVLVALMYAGIWLVARPSHFEVTDSELAVVFPVRRRRVPRHDVAGAQVLSLGAFRARFGLTLRVGAGGLFGTFGWLWSAREGWLDTWVTNLGDWVLVERRGGRPLVISPADPAALAAALAPDQPGAPPESR